MARDMDYINYVKSTAISSGFFNSDETGDRVYDADSISSLFDGLIKDGIYNTIGDMFKVSPNSGMIINIGSGRALFNHVWLKADSIVSIELTEATQYIDRIDAVIIEINKNVHEDDKDKNDIGRAGHIAVITGFASDDPQKPEMLHDGNVDQYPLAYIRVKANAEEITEADIENMVGTEETPFVTGLLEHVDISTLLTQYSAEARQQQTTDKKAFDDWFEHLQNELDENQAANLQNQINQITDWINTIGDAEEEEY